VLTGFGLAVEIGDWQRFTGATIGAWLGLVPSEQSSGGRRCQDSSTKTGNSHARRLLVEAAWHHRKPLSAQQGPAGSSRRPARRGPRTRRPRQPPTPPALVPAGCSGQALHHQRGRGRSRAGWYWSLAVLEA
jgi:transposase